MDIKLINIITNFMVLFAVIDITGSIPIIIDIKQKSGNVVPFKVTIVAFIFMLLFLFLGEPLLNMFGVDLSSFAIAGALVLFFLGLELVLGIEFFKYEYNKSSAIVPLSFPLIAGAGSMTTLISLKSEYSIFEILIALSLNMVFVYLVLKATRFFERVLGEVGIQILKKFFGIILLAVAIRLFLANTGIQLPHHGS
ncbi:MAG: MarC family protein [Bacteroidales bacterium]|nr:MarC family protein [Bacteroidales bacterium]MBN2817581.1 MarC family protein [Bacteroidales bacterium]